MSHAHNIDSALYNAAILQARGFTISAANQKSYMQFPNTSVLNQIVPAIQRTVVKHQGKFRLKEDSKWLEIACGSIAGITSKFIEHPFDTVKVRLQSQSQSKPLYNGTWDCIRKSVKQGAMYQGITSPLCGAVLENAILFVSYGWFLSVLNQEKPCIAANALAGAFSGACVSFLLTPVELVKCQVQMNGGTTMSVIKKTLRMYGVGGLYRGYAGTFLRETVGGAAWFGSYEYLNERTHSPWMAGAGAGIAFNAALFPADTIKSIQQTESIPIAGNGDVKRKSFATIGKSLWKREGIKGLYRGFGITAARAGPSSAMIFCTYESVKGWLKE